jgi:hypothetical protein
VGVFKTFPPYFLPFNTEKHHLPPKKYTQKGSNPNKCNEDYFAHLIMGLFVPFEMM